MRYVIQYYDLTLQQQMEVSFSSDSEQNAEIAAMKILADKAYTDPNLFKDIFDGV